MAEPRTSRKKTTPASTEQRVSHGQVCGRCARHDNPDGTPCWGVLRWHGGSDGDPLCEGHFPEAEGEGYQLAHFVGMVKHLKIEGPLDLEDLDCKLSGLLHGYAGQLDRDTRMGRSSAILEIASRALCAASGMFLAGGLSDRDMAALLRDYAKHFEEPPPGGPPIGQA